MSIMKENNMKNVDKENVLIEKEKSENKLKKKNSYL